VVEATQERPGELKRDIPVSPSDRAADKRTRIILVNVSKLRESDGLHLR